MSPKKIKLDIKYLQDLQCIQSIILSIKRIIKKNMVLNRRSSFCMLDRKQRENIINLLEISKSNKETKKLKERLVKKANYLNRDDIQLIYSLKRDYRRKMILDATKLYKEYEITVLLIVCVFILIFSQYLDNYI